MTLSRDEIIRQPKTLEAILEFITYILELGSIKVKSELITAGIIRLVLRIVEDPGINIRVALFCLKILKYLVKDDAETSKTLVKF